MPQGCRSHRPPNPCAGAGSLPGLRPHATTPKTDARCTRNRTRRAACSCKPAARRTSSAFNTCAAGAGPQMLAPGTRPRSRARRTNAENCGPRTGQESSADSEAVAIAERQRPPPARYRCRREPPRRLPADVASRSGRIAAAARQQRQRHPSGSWLDRHRFPPLTPRRSWSVGHIRRHCSHVNVMLSQRCDGVSPAHRGGHDARSRTALGTDGGPMADRSPAGGPLGGDPPAGRVAAPDDGWPRAAWVARRRPVGRKFSGALVAAGCLFPSSSTPRNVPMGLRARVRVRAPWEPHGLDPWTAGLNSGAPLLGQSLMTGPGWVVKLPAGTSVVPKLTKRRNTRATASPHHRRQE